MSEVRLSGVTKLFGDQRVLDGIDIEIKDREFMVFVGPSGCGKSTLLRTIAGLERASGGRIVIGDDDVTRTAPAKRGVAMVFQSYALYPHMSVYENIAFGLQLQKMSKEKIDERVREAAGVLQIEPLLERKPRALSGGQRQRVAIGRAIVRHPKVFLFDEPLSNLDAALRVQMRLELIRLHQRLDATMVYVTHDQIEAMTMADRIVVLNAGQVEQIGTPLELYRYPRNRFVAGFIGSPKMNFMTVQAEPKEDGIDVRVTDNCQLRLPLRPDAVQAGSVTFGIRPEHFTEPGSDERADSHIHGEVLVVEHLGGETLLHVRVNDELTLSAKGSGESPVAVGDRISLGINARHCHLFAQDGQAVPHIHRQAETAVGPKATATTR
ncbi:MAG TPA: sn-glycerol-3-phosphate ABC transporter ATP-binding protein UgpC [Gammaproteobacteria bacterium]|nr:sn-glycerol-3-phosphate ABC transporter ATP-binding protein UgpC [Gammaproteobacteria bacterium]